jgi:propionyl-CoA synthetase
MKAVYDVNPGEVYWAASDVGWVVGHSYIVYAPLFHGCTTILYEGKPVGTPDAGAFWRVISQHKVSVMFTAPTAFRAIKREDPGGELMKQYDLSHFRTLFLAGERTDPDTLHWAEDKLKVPVIDHWWQTETGWAIAANCMGLNAYPVKPGSPTKAVPGWNVTVLDDENQPVPAGQIGAICCKLPLPPGSLPTLWNADDRYVDSYLTEYPGNYMTADAGYVDEDGYLYIMARTEGQLPVGFLVLSAGVERADSDIVTEVVKLVREKIGPVAAFKQAVVVQRLPKTRSGKILRGTMQKIADNQEYKTPATIDDPAILPEIEEALVGIGYAKGRSAAS